ncbi:hypothetical protein CFB82_40045 [Burkholderia sp. HI2714]|uniref:hypothetical protein n=1 Tax=Burkholderia sp. HI2714 TaxID=2015359 RepID=UPI000B79FA03|nr:hypothetical protein [Burkholderia sp. HI2714]OXJ22586.1 hypothetical protein CFB82_40045 [Burkholderia sp. HI2714]
MRQDGEAFSNFVQSLLAVRPGYDWAVDDPAEIEELMERLRQSAYLLIDLYLDEEKRVSAREAYDAGIVVGLYGADSAIAWPYRAGAAGGETQGLALMCSFRRRMYSYGYEHGAILRLLLR